MCANDKSSAFKAIISKGQETILRTMAFASIQLNNGDRRKLPDGTSNEDHFMTFSAQVADAETFHYGDAMKQPDKLLFMRAMMKEVADLTAAEVFELKRKSEITSGIRAIKSIWSFKRKSVSDGTYT